MSSFCANLCYGVCRVSEFNVHIRPCHILKSFKSSNGVDKPTRNHLNLAVHDEPNSPPGQGDLGPVKKHKENSCIFGYPSAGAGTREGISFSPSHITHTNSACVSQVPEP